MMRIDDARGQIMVASDVAIARCAMTSLSTLENAEVQKRWEKLVQRECRPPIPKSPATKPGDGCRLQSKTAIKLADMSQVETG